MKKLTKILVLSILAVFLVAGSAMAVPFTMNTTQIQALYQTWENPTSGGTDLDTITDLPNGAKFSGKIRNNDPGWGTIQIGANFWGYDYDDAGFPGSLSTGDGPQPTVGSLGLGDLSGYTSYELLITNRNENPWKFNLYFNVGYTDFGETNYYVENTWTEINVDEPTAMKLDFTSAYVWGGTTYTGKLVDLSTVAGLDLSHISNIGFNIGGDVPLSNTDYVYEADVNPVPEPATMLLLGSGLIGLGVLGRKKFFKKA